MIEWVPTESALVVQAADPEDSVTGGHSSAVPSRNVIVPVAVPPEPVTLAVNVTAWPDTEGFEDEASETVGVVLAPATLNVYDATEPTSGWLCAPVESGTSWPSTANA